MIDSQKSLVSKLVTFYEFCQIRQLWQEMAIQCEGEKVCLNEENLLNSNTEKNNQNNLVKFNLIVSDEIQVLLIVEKQINDFYCQITITFSSTEISSFVDEILCKLNPQIQSTLKLLLTKENVFSSRQEELMFKLLEILTARLGDEENNYLHSYTHKPIELVLRNRIEQEKILQQVNSQIEQNLDLLVIVKMTIEQVKHLLQIDRIVIYQFNIPYNKSTQNINNPSNNLFFDAVTYEAKASEIIPSILNFRGDEKINHIYKNNPQYSQGISVVINDTHEEKLDVLEQELIEKFWIKSKVNVPIIVDKNLWGLLIVHQCFVPRKWTKNEIEFLEHISQYLALAIYQSNSYQELEKKKEMLEIQVEKRAKQLEDALIAGQMAHQSKAEFLGNMSHELKTPLTCIIGLSGTLLQMYSTGYKLSLTKEKHYLETIQNSGRKLLEIINKTLNFVEIESGKSLLKIDVIFLDHFCQEIWWYSLKIAKKKNIKLDFDFQIKTEDNKFYGDSERLTEIILNLLDNAIKFTPNGGKVIFQVWKENKQVIFQVEDNGIGIKEEQLPLLFTKFQQLENYLTRTHEGTGLGLALSKNLVELHGGRIEVESLLGKGSIFTVKIPYSQPQKINNITEQTLPYIWTNRTIILVSKNEEIATLICELLTADNYQLIWLFDSSGVVNKIQVLEPKLVILEEELSLVYKISKQIIDLQKSNHNQIKIAIICEEMNDNKWQELSESGINDYFLQPLQPEILLNKINDLMQSP